MTLIFKAVEFRDARLLKNLWRALTISALCSLSRGLKKVEKLCSKAKA
jgi:hypothetical protein